MNDYVEVLARRGGGYVVVLLDKQDHDRLGTRKLSIGSHGYAQMWDGTVQLVHRWILGLCSGDQLIGDHKNGNPLDNRRSNLRIVNPSGSSQNVKGRGRSRFRGVHPTGSGRWVARVKFKGKHHILGTFDDELDAARAADTKRRELMPDYVPRPDDVAALYGNAA